jgi:dTDP-glucose 4,6-dehydratase
MSRIVITGGAGFIGSHLADRLVGEGHELILIDNLFTGHPRNISHLAGNERVRFVKHDVTEFIYIGSKVDAILHLASLPSPVDYLRNRSRR